MKQVLYASLEHVAKPTRGHRFNALFHNVSRVFFLHEEIRKFLQGHQTNRLLQAVLQDLEVDAYIDE